MSRASKLASARGQAHSARHVTNVARDKLQRITNERDKLQRELADLRARLEKAEPIVAAARNLIEQKGRHNTEIAYKRLADAIAKERTT